MSDQPYNQTGVNAPLSVPANLFMNRPVAVDDSDLLELTQDLVSKSRGILEMIINDSVEGPHGGGAFTTNHHAVIHALRTVDGLMAQAEAVIDHNVITEKDGKRLTKTDT